MAQWRGVLFYSDQRWGPELANYETIAIPDNSATSIALLTWLLEQATGQPLNSRFQIYPNHKVDEAIERYGNALVIGDEALIRHSQPHWKGLHCHDLAQLWVNASQGLPFVFAVWVARRSAWENRQEEITQVIQALQNNKERNLSNTERLQAIVDYAQTFHPLAYGELERYFTRCLNFDWSAQHEAGLALFFERLKTLDPGLVKPA